MAKLTDRQRKRIIAEYANGGVSQRQLAERYHVSQNTIAKLLKTDKSVQKISKKKEENTLSMLEFMEKQKDRAQNIMQQILDCSDDEIKKASLRDKMGALKILSDIFCTNTDSRKPDNSVTKIIVQPIDASGESNDTDD